MWFILSLVLLLCSTASESASFNFPRQKLPALTEKIEALLVNGDDGGGGGGKIVDGGSVNSGGGGGDGKFLQLWRDNAAAANNITNDHDENDGIIYLYLNLIESRMIHNSKSF